MPPASTPADAAAAFPSLDHLLLYRLSRLLDVAGSLVTRLCEGRYGITRREWRLLATLARHGALSSSALAEQAQLDRARTSKALGSLVAKQLVSRVQPAGDRRQVQVALTDAGRALYDALFPLVAALNAELLTCLEPGQAQTLDAALARLQTQAGQMVATLGDTLPKADRRRGRPAA